ncbi:hypothetical protein [Psychrobacter sp.]|uniref:hypothetical protein n=1 Tax=Psychrobacter sp. TaxID=56811 RepID=UPI002FD9811A
MSSKKSGFEADAIRSHCYAYIGAFSSIAITGQGKKRNNVIGGFYEKMQFALHYFEQNINNNIFYDWYKHTLIPYFKTKFVIVMDMSEEKAKYCFARA